MDAGARLGALFREMGLTREAVADALDMSRDAIDNWCSGRSHVSLANLGPLIKFLEQGGAPPERLRELLLLGLVNLGLDEDITSAYLGKKRLPRRYDAFVLVVHDLRGESLMLAATQTRDYLLREGREVVVLDCCGRQSIRKFYLEELIPLLAPAGVFICRSVANVELDAPAAKLARLGIPTVYLQERPRVLPRNAAFVGWDERRLGHLAGTRVVEAGHENIAAIVFDGADNHAARKEGFDQAIANLGSRMTESKTLVAQVRDPFRDSGLVAEIQTFLCRHRPQVVFAPSPSVALEVFQAVSSFGGDELDSLACVAIVDDGWRGRLMQAVPRPRFDIVKTPIQAAATKAVEIMFRLTGSQLPSLEERTIEVACLE